MASGQYTRNRLQPEPVDLEKRIPARGLRQLPPMSFDDDEWTESIVHTTIRPRYPQNAGNIINTNRATIRATRNNTYTSPSPLPRRAITSNTYMSPFPRPRRIINQTYEEAMLSKRSGIREKIKEFFSDMVVFLYFIGAIVILYYLFIGVPIGIQWLALFFGHFWPYVQKSEVIPPLANIAGIIQGIAVIVSAIGSIFYFLRRRSNE